MSTDSETTAKARVGSVLNDKWTLVGLLGVGGMAAVYSARHRNGARAAVKVLHPDYARNAEVRERFLREGYAANRVEHPGVVKVLDDDVVREGPDTGTAYLVMELLEGESLEDRIERGEAVSEREFLAIADEVLDVLEAAHARGVVHRDLKPENLFLVDTPERHVKVLDFGLARLLQGQSITTYGLAIGTPSFMAPEQAAGHTDEIDGRTDLFSLAATGFRLVTGKRIHEGATPVELVTKMARLPAPPIRGVAPHVSKPFARVIDRALQFQREDRHPDATSMRADVARAIEELEGVAPTVLAASVSLPKPASPPKKEPTIELSAADLQPAEPSIAPEIPAHRSRRLPAFLMLVAAALVAFVGVRVGLQAWSRANQTTTAPPRDTSPPPPPASTPEPPSQSSVPLIVTTAMDAETAIVDASTVDAAIADAAIADADDEEDDDAEATDGSSEEDAALADAGDAGLDGSPDAAPPRAATSATAAQKPPPPRKPPTKPPRRAPKKK